jgi:hypothetical protein
MTLENKICYIIQNPIYEELKRLNEEYLEAKREYNNHLYSSDFELCNELYKEYKEKELILVTCRDFAETILNKQIIILTNGNIKICD